MLYILTNSLILKGIKSQKVLPVTPELRNLLGSKLMRHLRQEKNIFRNV